MKHRIIPATRAELERLDLTETERDSFLRQYATLEEATRTTREARLLNRLRKHYPCGRCLQPLGERQGGFTWDAHTLTWVHVRCPRKRGSRTVPRA